jgi:hydrogenase-4 component E
LTAAAASGSQAILAWDMMASALFLLVTLGIVATRQMLASLRLFVLQSCVLALSATLIGIGVDSGHLLVVAGISIAAKAIGIPWLLKGTLREELYGRREIDQALTIPTSLILAAGLVLFGFFLFARVFQKLAMGYAAVNLPVGIACVLLGVFTVTVRREALAQLMGLLAMENAVFFAGISIAPHLSLLAEIAAAIDVPAMALVIGLLIRQIHRRLGTTRVGELAALKEQ